jgi:hypothetical protein
MGVPIAYIAAVIYNALDRMLGFMYGEIINSPDGSS